MNDSRPVNTATGKGTIIGLGSCYALGTFTDNFYKQAAILMAAPLGMSGVQSIATVLFSLPFILFSAWGGALADRVAKKSIAIGAKSLELIALLFGGYMLLIQNWAGIIAVIFLMGTQSTFFSPAINGAIPESFTSDRVPRANALIKLASTAAILAGFALAGFVLDLRPGSFLPNLGLAGEDYGRAMAAFFVIAVALIGLLTAFSLQRKQAQQGVRPPFPWAGPLQSIRQIRECRKDRELFLAVIANAWFFGIAAVAVISIANLAASFGYSKSMSGCMMALLMIGVAGGALAGGRFSVDSWRRVILPVGSGMSVSLLLVAATPLIPLFEAFDARTIWFGATLFMAGFFGGMYIIPLESFIQVRPAAHEKGKVIGVSNFVSFVAMAIFGAAFTLISLLPPALNFAAYGLATALFLFFFARRHLASLPEASLRDKASSFLGFFMRCVLCLRYSVTEKGLNAIAPFTPQREKGPGMLVLPNHPALVDPILVYSRVAGLSLRPLSDEGQMRGFIPRSTARFLRAVTIPDLGTSPGRSDAAAATREGIARIVQALKSGDNVLLYPAGRLYRSTREILGNNSAVATILAGVPEARVLLVRTRGLWGSSFSYASGKAPRLMAQIGRGALTVLANLLFFTPRRKVTIEFTEPADLPRDGDKRGLNRYLESFYNKAETPPLLVRRFFWQSRNAECGPREEAGAKEKMQEGISPAVREQTDILTISDDTREAVYAILRERANLPADVLLSPEQRLTQDLYFDSLALMETLMALEEGFGHTVPSPESLVTVGDCLRAATGLLETEEELAPVAAPDSWLAPHADDEQPLIVPNGISNILDSFFLLCREDPERPITAERGGVRSRRDLLTGVLALARRFSVLPGKRLGMMLPSVPAALTVWLAAMYAHKEPVFINWTVGRRNLEHCLELTGCSHVVSASALMDQVQGAGTSLNDLPVTWIAVDKLAGNLTSLEKIRAAALARLHCSFLPFALTGGKTPETAAVLFTSGSETRPKGVALSHANILCNARDVLSMLGVRRGDKLLAMLPPFHSFGLLVGLALPASTGIAAAFHANPTESARLVTLIRDFRLSVFGATPTFLEAMLAKAGKSMLASLRYVFVGAEKCPEHVYHAFTELCPEAALCEGYGITECSPVVAVNRPGDTLVGSIGHVLPSVEAILVREEESPDGAWMPVSRADAGEAAMLLVRGPSVFAGYLEASNGAPATAPHPFVSFEGKNWYRTGDIVRMDADKRLFFVGRRKRFVKIGGEMISLPLMEEVLLQTFAPLAKDVEDGRPFLAVTDVPGKEGESELVAFTTLDLSLATVNPALRKGGLAPLYAVKRVIHISAIPLLGSGKTDYRSLQGQDFG